MFVLPISWSGTNAEGKDYEIVLDVVKANIVQTLKHDRLAFQGVEAKVQDPDEFTAIVFLYPCCIAGSNNVKIIREKKVISWPISFDEFLELPADFIDMWISKIYELNPRWRGSKLEASDFENKVLPEDPEKKHSKSQDDLTSSSRKT